MKITSAGIALLAGVAWLALGGAAAAEPCRQEIGNLQKQLSDLGIASSRQRNDLVDRAIQHADNQEHERCDNLAAELDYLVAMVEPGPRPQSAPRLTPRNLWPAEVRQAAQPGASPAGAGGEQHVAQASSQAPQQGSAGEAAKPITGEPTTSQPPQAEGQKPTGGAAQASPEENASAKQQTAQPGAQKPGKAAAAQACPSPVTVEKGDTLLSIARRCDKTLKAIVQANPDLQNPNLIRVGQKIRMPTG